MGYGRSGRGGCRGCGGSSSSGSGRASVDGDGASPAATAAAATSTWWIIGIIIDGIIVKGVGRTGIASGGRWGRTSPTELIGGGHGCLIISTSNSFQLSTSIISTFLTLLKQWATARRREIEKNTQFRPRRLAITKQVVQNLMFDGQTHGVRQTDDSASNTLIVRNRGSNNLPDFSLLRKYRQSEIVQFRRRNQLSCKNEKVWYLAFHFPALWLFRHVIPSRQNSSSSYRPTAR